MSFRYFSSKTIHSLVFLGVLMILFYLGLLLFFSGGKALIKVDYLFTGLLLAFLLIPIGINLFLLIPKWLTREQYLKYALSFLTLFGLTIASWNYFVLSAYERMFSSYFFSTYLLEHNLYLVFSVLLLSSMLLYLAKEWIYLNRSENQSLKLKNIKVENQLSALRSQIHPHFLFNSLNVIYSLALDKNKDIDKAIVNLSDVLRHVIYENYEETTTLEKEVNLLTAYIEFQEYRVASESTVNIIKKIENPQYKIAPMLLLPLLENSFKHGVHRNKLKDPIHIEIHQEHSHFDFKIQNTFYDLESEKDKAHSGAGLSNLEESLALLYANQHNLKITKTENTFTVHLQLFNEYH